MNLAQKLDHIIHFLAQRRYLIPAGLILGGVILFSMILRAATPMRKKDYK